MGFKPRGKSYDKAKWHFGADDFPPSLAPEAGAKHIAWFLRWACHNDLASDEHRALRSVEDRGIEYFMRQCDGSLIDEDLNARGNSFAAAAYNEYLRQYEAHFSKVANPTYLVPDTAEHFAAAERILDDLLEAWSRSST